MKPHLIMCRSNPIAPDPRVEREAHTLASAGYKVTLLGWDRTGELPPHDYVKDIPCHRLQIQAKYATGMHNLPDLLRWQWGLLSWLVRHRHTYDIIHACDFDTILPGLVCQSLFHKIVIYDIFDFYADHLRATPKFVKKVIRAVDLWAIGRVDAVILADDSRWEQIRGARPRHNAVIYNTPEDIPQTSPATPNSAPEHGLRVVYVGLLQVERGLLELLCALQKHPEWSLDLAGFGGDETLILQQTHSNPNVHWHGRVSYKTTLQLSSAADVLIATYDPAIPNHRYSSPNKVFEAMMLGKPIIVARHTNMDRIITAAGCGLVVPYGDVPALEEALARLQEDVHLRRSLSENARKTYETTYSWTIMQTRLLDLYQAVRA